jgi:general transcription factor 3C polypeptide 3 (transcription factor C subunit 4)
VLIIQGVVRIAKERKGQKQDFDTRAKEIQDRLERTMGCKWRLVLVGNRGLRIAVEDETPQEESGPSKYLVMRQTDFYGLDMEEWLVLVIKVSLGASSVSASWDMALIAQYCCVLMVKSEEDVAMDILEHVVWSGLFNNARAEVALRLAIVGKSTCLAFLGGVRPQALEVGVEVETVLM